MSDAEFQGKPHEALYAMVADAKPEHLHEVGKALKKAFADLDGISRDLKEHVGRVRLEGEGGDAFRKWGEQMVMQTTKLAHYVSSVGSAMDHASEGLTKARSSMPKPTGSVCFTDPEKERARLKAAETDRQHAVDAMRTLDSYYRTVQADLGRLEEPRFVLPPALQAAPEEGWERPYEASPSSGHATDGGSFGSPSSHAVGGSGGAAFAAPHVDSAATGALLPGTVGHGSVGAGAATAPGAGSTSGTNVDSTTVLPSSHTLVPAPDPVQHHGGAPAPQGPGGPPPVLPPMPGGLTMPRGAGLPRPDEGIVGGLPARPGGGAVTAKLPRGTVVGDERGLPGRGPMGAGGYPGAAVGMPGAHGIGVGRRSASEPGGVVGSPRGSVSEQALSRARSEFTQGGSGLVRGTQAPGAVPHVGAVAPGAARRSTGGRPSYLTEDEETWTGGRRNTVPPVIE